MYYTTEKLKSIWDKFKPQYFKVVRGKHKGGIFQFDSSLVSLISHANDDNDKKAPPLSIEEMEANATALWDAFEDTISDYVDGIYTIDLRRSKKDPNGAPYSFKLGDGAIDDSEEEASSMTGVMRTSKMGATQGMMPGMGNNMMVMMMTMMQNHNKDMMTLIQNQQNLMQTEKEKNWKQELELFKVKNRNTDKTDKILGMISSPHFANTINAFKGTPSQVVGRIQAQAGQYVPPPPPDTDGTEVDNTEGGQPDPPPDVVKLQNILATIAAKFPGQNPVDMLELGVSSFMSGDYNQE